MPIHFQCVSCGKQMKAPDSAAGKLGRCPSCGTRQQVPQAGILDAVPVADPEPAFARVVEDTEYAVADQPAGPPPQESRRPCPMCGEMILATAVKCRFCGEIFDATLREATHVDPELVKRFRREIHGLGGAWIFFGVMCMILAMVFPALGGANVRMDEEERVGAAVVFGLIALLWLTAGIGSCFKQLWALYFGLVVSYVSALGNLITMFSAKIPNPCALIIVVIIIVQAHRTIGWANKMKKARIALNTRPEQIRARFR